MIQVVGGIRPVDALQVMAKEVGPLLAEASAQPRIPIGYKWKMVILDNGNRLEIPPLQPRGDFPERSPVALLFHRVKYCPDVTILHEYLIREIKLLEIHAITRMHHENPFPAISKAFPVADKPMNLFGRLVH